MDKVTEAVDNGEFVISVFIDLSKAFDTIDHLILLKKLYHYGLRGQAYQLIKNYLSSRQECVTFDGITSNSL